MDVPAYKPNNVMRESMFSGCYVKPCTSSFLVTIVNTDGSRLEEWMGPV